MAPRSPGRSRGRRPFGWFKGLIIRVPRRAWLVVGLFAFVCTVAVIGVLSYYWVVFGRRIDARLHGERERVLPRVYARPFELYRGQALGVRELVDRLNDLGYAERVRVEKPGEFALERDAITLVPRDGDQRGIPVRVTFEPPRPAPATPPKVAPLPQVIRIIGLQAAGARADKITLDPPLLTALISTG